MKPGGGQRPSLTCKEISIICHATSNTKLCHPCMHQFGQPWNRRLGFASAATQRPETRVEGRIWGHLARVCSAAKHVEEALGPSLSLVPTGVAVVGPDSPVQARICCQCHCKATTLSLLLLAGDGLGAAVDNLSSAGSARHSAKPIRLRHYQKTRN